VNIAAPVIDFLIISPISVCTDFSVNALLKNHYRKFGAFFSRSFHGKSQPGNAALPDLTGTNVACVPFLSD